MKKIVFILIFFICFFRISIFHNSLYLAIPVAVLGIASLVVDKSRLNFFLNAIGNLSLFILLYFLIFSIVIDIVTGSIFVDFLQTFTIRTVSLFVISIIPAYYIVFFYIKGSSKRILDLIYWAFIIQTIFFILTYADLSFKTSVYNVLGASNSVNMSEMNFSLRGFGFSNEINFMTPFLMTVISLFYFRGLLFKVVIFSTQIINSNNVLVAAILSLFFSRANLLAKITLTSLGILGFVYFSSEYLPRLTAELDSGGQRTIGYLLNSHFFTFNDGVLQNLLGSGIYVFGGLAKKISDVGYVILYNYGGILMLILFLLFIVTINFRLGLPIYFKVLWLATGLILNFKGLVFGMNGYIFFSFLVIFNYQYNMRYYDKFHR
ncbi:TPA: hypothetical protein I7187_10715 [Vibrio vulnificus]|nr:hypothetical protein [Vibrio vulnificus]